jgi:ribose-phosphate pyrophosphokinase
MNDIVIFSGESNQPLAKKIALSLNTELGEIYHHKFPSGELYCQFKHNIRGKDVFLIQGPGNGSSNDYLMQLLIMADAARRASAGKIIAVMPMMFYTRQDKKDKSRVPISAKLTLDLIQSSGIDRVLTMDLHSPQICGFTNLPFDHLTFEPILYEYINKNFDKNDLIIMAPDVGAVKRAEKYATLLKCGFGFISKKRVDDEKVELLNIVGDIDEKDVIIIDDLTESVGTLVQAATACKDKGATKVVCAVTHGCFTETGRNRLSESISKDSIPYHKGTIDLFLHSNTVDMRWDLKYKPDNIIELDVSSLFAKAINNVHNNESVSELFI